MSTSERQSGEAAGTPWVSVALVVACFALTAYSWQISRARLPLAEERLERAETYLLEHPYLEASHGLGARLGAELMERKREEYRFTNEARGALATPPEVAARQQEKLDDLVAQGLVVLDDLPAARYGMQPSERRPASFLSHFGLHSGPSHLLGNTAFLLLLGFYLEAVWGRMAFGLFAAAAIALSAFVFAAANPELERPLVGSSGLLAGMLGAFAIRFWRSRSEGFYVFALSCGALWLIAPVVLGTAWSLEHPGSVWSAPPVDPQRVFWSYQGGLLAGVVACVVIALFGGRTRGVASRGSPGRQRPDQRFDEARRARELGDLERAFALLEELVFRQPDAHHATEMLWEVAQQLQRPAMALPALVAATREAVRRGQDRAAVQHWLSLSRTGIPDACEAALLFRMAHLLREADEPSAAIDALRAALHRTPASESAVVASRVARAARDLDPNTATDAAWRALGSRDLSLEERQSLELLLAEILPRATNEPTASDATERPESGASTPPGHTARRPEAIAIETDARSLESCDATPVELDEQGLWIVNEDGRKQCVAYGDLAAVAVGAVEGLASKPVIVVDLILNWMSMRDEPLRILRLRGDRFDPRRLAPECGSAVDALRRFIQVLLERSGGIPLPDPQAAIGRPFACFESLLSYHHAVLMVDAPD